MSSDEQFPKRLYEGFNARDMVTNSSAGHNGRTGFALPELQRLAAECDFCAGFAGPDVRD
jgi:hypothetical protein